MLVSFRRIAMEMMTIMMKTIQLVKSEFVTVNPPVGGPIWKMGSAYDTSSCWISVGIGAVLVASMVIILMCCLLSFISALDLYRLYSPLPLLL
jgi:hypothetical protein